MAAIWKEVWDRVVLSYKSTLLGVGIGVAIIVLERLSTFFASMTQGWGKVVAAVIMIALAALKSRAVANPPLPPPT